MRKPIAVLCLICAVFLFAGCAAPAGQSAPAGESPPADGSAGPPGSPAAPTGPSAAPAGPAPIGITEHPPPAVWRLSPLTPLSGTLGGFDLRSCDLTALDLTGRLDDLMMSCFDSRTTWPDKLPAPFNPGLMMDLGKNPGLGVRSPHQRGVTGEGIGIAIIDQALLVDHQEYRGRLRHYEEIHCLGTEAAMHGSAVTSIAVGEATGVAPGADVYYIAETHGTYAPAGFEWDLTWVARSIDRVLEINRALPPEKRIRVISKSLGFTPDRKGYEDVMKSIEKAKEQGVFVVCCSLDDLYGVALCGLGREPPSDPDRLASYGPGLFWEFSFFGGHPLPDKTLLAPMDSRCLAAPTGESDYVFYRAGGLSWAVPYVAGLYALACQVKPDITPEAFLEAALKTGDTVEVKENGMKFRLGQVVNPVKLIEYVQGLK